MIGLFDKDVFLKLCCCDLLADFIAAVGLKECYRLASLGSAKSNEKSMRKLLRGLDDETLASAIGRVQDAISNVGQIPDELAEDLDTDEMFLRLTEVESVDVGEAQLVTILQKKIEAGCMITGDKRFLKALSEDVPELWCEVKSSIICFEACLIALVREYGYEYVVKKVSPVSCCDKVLKLVVSGTNSEADFIKVLQSYLPEPPQQDIAPAI
ncbi:hypothetical protein SAMN05444141_11149 [Pseudovibrio denitrificans]|uniref:Uncharacterized protein n=1 Tax=Pseudovibrio denitrificans TaxID=258256 RepID=A0A1I7DVA8_9HYPH|nr:hypothetical protein [Pseudovibrio denitrificans]SFU15556.1 hypothetical protein SAMN05444141_11149 [Pseudovibrio denitrificans]